jgi:glycerol-3-phosphate acyltransferase PlsY
LLIFGLVSYLIGGLPTAYIAARKLKGLDIRRVGDRNPGAANVYRSIGPAAGIAVAAIDIAKGSVAVLLARLLVDSTPMEMIAGAAVIVGHTWPVYLRLKGGRGAATAAGVLLAMMPVLAIPLALLALVVLLLTKNAMKSLGFFFICLPLLAFWPAHYSIPLVMFSLGVPLMVGFTHYLSVRPQSGTNAGGEPALPQG